MYCTVKIYLAAVIEDININFETLDPMHILTIVKTTILFIIVNKRFDV